MQIIDKLTAKFGESIEQIRDTQFYAQLSKQILDLRK